MAKILLFGEPMVMFLADTVGPLEEAQHFTRKLAGAEVNVAIGFTRLGHSASYVTRLGNDMLGQYINNTLQQEKIGAEITYDQEHFTGFQLKEQVSEGDPRVCYFRRNSAASCLSPADVREADFSGAALLHVTGIPPALSPTARAATYCMIERAREEGILVSFDPNLRPGLWESEAVMTRVLNDLASRCDIILPGCREGHTLMGSEAPEEIADYYLSLGAGMVTVKLGERGSFTKTKTESFYQKCMPVDKIVDTVGAGDGFAVGILSGLLEGLALYEAVERGNAIGALQLRHSGDNEGLPTREILADYLKAVKSGVFAGSH